MSDYARGNVVRLTGTFYDIDDAVTDPAAVSFQYKFPGGSTVTLVYGTDAAVVKSSTGVYYVDLATDTVGITFYRFLSTGTGKAAAWSQFQVKTDPLV